jgi:hypothetical protein
MVDSFSLGTIMTPHNLKIWAQINAVIARIEAMKALNISRTVNGYDPPYTNELFEMADEIERLGNSFE